MALEFTYFFMTNIVVAKKYSIPAMNLLICHKHPNIKNNCYNK